MPSASDDQLYENFGRSVTMQPHQTFRHVPLAPHELTQKITPQSDLFVLAHMGVPRINIENWTLSVTGLVRDSTTFTFDKIRKFIDIMNVGMVFSLNVVFIHAAIMR